ncbi:MAG: hypothetical protein FIA93_10665 [Deltaproteobacteria bacterium]|nr:hypothetical protein [Deltaproteobacteria bacterium]
MLALRRVFIDGPARPDLVLLHFTAAPEEAKDRVIARASLVLTPTGKPRQREGRIFLPSPLPGRRFLVRYFYSTIGGGSEWFSPVYEVPVPCDEVAGDLVPMEETDSGNLPPAPGAGWFRLLLPARNGEPRTGTVRFGFGAMRKKPSPSLCRAAISVEGNLPVIEVPEALSVLKNRPMPFYLYHVAGENGLLVADKINCARLTLRDEEGSVVCARILWGDPTWNAQNFSAMEVKNFAAREGRASNYFFAGDREAFLRTRSEAIGAHPLPRTFEAFVFGPEGSVVEYCYQVLLRRPGGTVAAAWRNREGGNWSVTL